MGFWNVFKKVGVTAGKIGLQVGIPALETFVPLSKPVIDKIQEAISHSGEAFDAKTFLKSALPIAMAEVRNTPQFSTEQITVIHAIIEAAFIAGKGGK
jgi:hypothetical protein